MKFGHFLMRNLVELGFEGKVYPVNPNTEDVLGLKTYPNINLIPDEVDLAVIIVPAQHVLQVMRDCGQKHVKGVVICSSGFRESGGEGIKREEAVIEIAKKAGMRVLGPNTTGIVNASNNFTTSFIPLPKLRKGSVAFIAQTGLFAAAAFWWILTAQPFDLTKVIGLGNKSDVDDAEALEYLAQDEETKVIAIYMEGIKDGPRFFKAAQEVVKSKPIIVVKSGRSEFGKNASRSHTGSLAVKDEIFDAVCKQTGIIRVKELEELMDIAKAFALQPLPNGNRIGIASITGAGCVMAADECAEQGLEIARLSDETLKKLRSYVPEWATVANPFDTEPLFESVGPESAVTVALESMLEDESVDCAIFVLATSPVFKFDINAVISDVLKKYPKKPVVANIIGPKDLVDFYVHQLEGIKIPVYPSIKRGISALAALYKYRMTQKRAAPMSSNASSPL
jgi:acyl-CoA synthetase (NDP forming)